MNQRGQYGTARVGQVIPAPAVYVAREREPSTVAWILGAAVLGSALLWARHQSRQIEQLYKKTELPYQSFTTSLRQSAGASLRGIAERVRPKRQGRNG